MTTVKKTTKVSIKEHTFTVPFPTIGQFIKIEGLKQSLTDGNYAIMAFGMMKSSGKALDLVDAISYLGVLIGEPLFSVFKLKSADAMLNMSMENGEELIRAYREEFSPFYNSIEERADRPKTKDTQKEESAVQQGVSA